MNNPLISIIVPVYKVEKYLDECVESIVNQTYHNLEIILVNDGSPDQCPQMCDDWAKRDPRIQVIHKRNEGASAARNVALDIAKGDYIGFVDSDDYCSETMFEDLLVSLNGAKSKISYCSAYRVLMNGRIKPLTSVYKSIELNTVEAVNSVFFGRADTAVWSKLFEKSVFDNIRFPEGEVNEEFPILVPLIVKSGGMVCTGKALYYYRAREGSVTNSNYLCEANSGTIYKNLQRIKHQVEKYGLSCDLGLRFFSARFAYTSALSMEKRFPRLNENVKNDYRLYRNIIKENAFIFLLSRYSKLKDKILYLLVLTRLLRPLYMFFYKDHL